MQFSYRGKDDRGGVQQGLLGAPNADAAATELMRRGITPLAIREVQETESVIDFNFCAIYTFSVFALFHSCLSKNTLYITGTLWISKRISYCFA